MDNETIKESAKAVQEVAKTTGKAIDAGEKFGGFISKFIQGPLEDGIGIFHDKLKYMRWERQIRFMKRSEGLLNELGLSNPTRPVPMKIAIPLMQAASVEEDDDLQDRWAKLLVNAANAESDIEVKRAYISILEDLSPMDAKILEMICSVPFDIERKGVLTYMLPDKIAENKLDDKVSMLRYDVQLSLGNLIRLGCITSNFTWGGGQVLSCVESTVLGRSFVEACTLQKRKI